MQNYISLLLGNKTKKISIALCEEKYKKNKIVHLENELQKLSSPPIRKVTEVSCNYSRSGKERQKTTITLGQEGN